MRTAVTETSLQAYHGLPARQLMSQADRIMAAVDKGCRTRNEIARSTGMPINAVTGRVNELIAAGRLYRGLPVRDMASGKQCETVRRTPRQGSLI